MQHKKTNEGTFKIKRHPVTKAIKIFRSIHSFFLFIPLLPTSSCTQGHGGLLEPLPGVKGQRPDRSQDLREGQTTKASRKFTSVLAVGHLQTRLADPTRNACCHFSAVTFCNDSNFGLLYWRLVSTQHPCNSQNTSRLCMLNFLLTGFTTKVCFHCVTSYRSFFFHW